jgi:hypothetical protein
LPAASQEAACGPTCLARQSLFASVASHTVETALSVAEVLRAMRNIFFVLVWTFVVFVAGYDVYFAWQYRAGFHEWELNPLARWIAKDFGITTLFLLKLAMMVFVVAVAAYCHRRKHRLELPYTLIISGVHVLLWLHYLFGSIGDV